MNIFDDIAKKLQMPDSVMQPDVLDTLRLFLHNGGVPHEAIRMLSSSYQGYAQMCNLLAHWLKLTGVTGEDIKTNNEKVIETVVLQKFNAKKADTIIHLASQVPKWVQDLIEVPKWRQLIYKLLADHKDCELLNFTIQLISESGLQEEICTLPSASVYFKVYIQILSFSLQKLINAKSEIELNSLIPEFIAMCTYNQQTYTFSQTILQTLMQEENGKNLSRISQEIYNAVKDKPIAGQLEVLCKNYHDYPEELFLAISSILRSKCASQGDIKRLYDLYANQTEKPPPVYFIQRVDLLDLVMKEILQNYQTISGFNLHMYGYVLAYASTKNPDVDNVTYEEKMTIDKIIDLLKIFLSKVREQLIGLEFQYFLIELYDTVEYPILSVLVLKWISDSLCNISWYESASNMKSLVSLLDLVNEITLQQPLQRSYVFNLLLEIFFLETELDPIAAAEVKKRVLDCCVYLVECGYVIPVMSTVSKWFVDVDLSLIRYFTTKVLLMIQPPYSQDFLSLLADIIISLGMSSLEMEDYRGALSVFVVHCTNSETNVLTVAQSEFFEKLKKRL